MTTSTSRPEFDFWNQWWRVGGVFGIAWIIVFIVGAVILQADTPTYDDPINEIRQYWAEDGDQYLIADYITGLAFVFLFIPFLASFRGLLAWAEGGAGVWSWVMLLGGLSAVLIAAAASASWGALALALGVAEDPEVDDSLVRMLMYVDAYAFASLGLALSLMVIAGSIVIARTAVLWRWLAILGVIVGIAAAISPLWVIDGDMEEGFFGVMGLVGSLGSVIWLLIVCIGMIMKQVVTAHPIQQDPRPPVA
jgi:hypothetical protein